MASVEPTQQGPGATTYAAKMGKGKFSCFCGAGVVLGLALVDVGLPPGPRCG